MKTWILNTLSRALATFLGGLTLYLLFGRP